MSNHPSYLELDLHSRGSDHSGVSAHLAECAECQSYVARMGDRVGIPTWASDLASAPPRRSWFGWLMPLAATACAVVVVLTVVRGRDNDEIRAKAAPAVSLFFKRGNEVLRWDGTAPFRAGDELRIEVYGEGLAHIAVANNTASTFAVLYRGELSLSAPTLIPRSWRLDAAADDDLSIVMSTSVLTDDELKSAIMKKIRNENIWTSVLLIQREPL